MKIIKFSYEQASSVGTLTADHEFTQEQLDQFAVGIWDSLSNWPPQNLSTNMDPSFWLQARIDSKRKSDNAGLIDGGFVAFRAES